MLPDVGPNGPKHVGAIERDILSVSCSILCFNKECICCQKKPLNLSKCTVKQQLKINRKYFDVPVEAHGLYMKILWKSHVSVSLLPFKHLNMEFCTSETTFKRNVY
jgi:hypothetical protein